MLHLIFPMTSNEGISFVHLQRTDLPGDLRAGLTAKEHEWVLFLLVVLPEVVY